MYINPKTLSSLTERQAHIPHCWLASVAQQFNLLEEKTRSTYSSCYANSSIHIYQIYESQLYV